MRNLLKAHKTHLEWVGTCYLLLHERPRRDCCFYDHANRCYVRSVEGAPKFQLNTSSPCRTSDQWESDHVGIHQAASRRYSVYQWSRGWEATCSVLRWSEKEGTVQRNQESLAQQKENWSLSRWERYQDERIRILWTFVWCGFSSNSHLW